MWFRESGPKAEDRKMENGKEGKFLSSSQELHYVDEDETGDLFHVKSVSGNVSTTFWSEVGITVVKRSIHD